MKNLVIKQIGELSHEAESWLIKDLWPNHGVGIIAAEPKCGKTWLALEVAVSVATGTKCLDQYPIETPGAVLFYNGEDAESIQGDRIGEILKAKGIKENPANLKVIIADSLRLDEDASVAALRQTVSDTKPVLLILDPFVRLHQINENNSAKVAQLLGKLRQIEKDFGTAVILVHHSKKTSGKNVRAGQKMRGSGELHAWGDANLYLTKDAQGRIVMDVELRTSESRTGIPLKLSEMNGGIHLTEETEPTIFESVSAPEAVNEPNLQIVPSGQEEFREPMEFKSREELNQDEVYGLIPVYPISVLEVMRSTALKAGEVSKALYELEKKKLIVKGEGGFRRTP